MKTFVFLSLLGVVGVADAQFIIQANGNVVENGKSLGNLAAENKFGNSLDFGSGKPIGARPPQTYGMFAAPQNLTNAGTGGVTITVLGKANATASAGATASTVTAAVKASRSMTALQVASVIATGSKVVTPVGAAMTALPVVLYAAGYIFGNRGFGQEIIADRVTPPYTENPNGVEVNFGPLGGVNGWTTDGQAACQANAGNYYSGHGGLKKATYGWSTAQGKPICGVECNDGWQGFGYGDQRPEPFKCPNNATRVGTTNTCMCDSGYFEVEGAAKQSCRLPADTPTVVLNQPKLETALKNNSSSAAGALAEAMANGLASKSEFPGTKEAWDISSTGTKTTPGGSSSSPLNYPNGQPVMSRGGQVEAEKGSSDSTTIARNPTDPAKLDVTKARTDTSSDVQNITNNDGTYTTTVTTTTTNNTTVNNSTTTNTTRVINTYNSITNNTTTPNNPPVTTTTETVEAPPTEFPSDYAKSTDIQDLRDKLLEESPAPDDPTLPADSDYKDAAETLNPLKSWSLPGHASQCPTGSFVTPWNATYTIDAHCGLINTYWPMLQAAMAVVWAIGAMFIVLRA